MSPPSATHWQTLAVSFSSCTIAPSLDNVVVIVVSSTREQRFASRRAAGALSRAASSAVSDALPHEEAATGQGLTANRIRRTVTSK